MILTGKQMAAAKAHLKMHYNQETLAALCRERMDYRAEHPDAGSSQWFLPHHLSEGIAIRNCLRMIIPDAQLLDDDAFGWSIVTGWDDYYISVVNAVLDELESDKIQC